MRRWWSSSARQSSKPTRARLSPSMAAAAVGGCGGVSGAQRRAATLCGYGQRVLMSSDPEEKVQLTRHANEAWASRAITSLGDLPPPERPARPPFPQLRDRRNMPGAKELNVPLHIYLLHSLAHIELNAVDLGWDLILRFRKDGMPNEFYTDWVSVLSDEARHFSLLTARLTALGYHYGVIPAHDSLLKDGETTAHSLKARLAIIALVHETHGLDSWERLVQRFKSCADHGSANIVNSICQEEIGHVKKGIKWFRYLCERDCEDPEKAFQTIVEQAQVPICGPFNKPARDLAGMPDDWYVSLQRKRKHPPKPKMHMHAPLVLNPV